MGKLVKQINALEESIKALSDQGYKTLEFRQRFNDGETLNQLFAFAVVREASQRVLGMRHFDGQMIGGITLHEEEFPKRARVKAKLDGDPAILSQRDSRQGRYIVTVNDYLASQDARWMGPVHEFLWA